MTDNELKSLVSSCLKKHRYSNEQSALEAIIRAHKNRSKDELRVYFCKHCLGYHLTHTKFREKNNEVKSTKINKCEVAK